MISLFLTIDIITIGKIKKKYNFSIIKDKRITALVWIFQKDILIQKKKILEILKNHCSLKNAGIAHNDPNSQSQTSKCVSPHAHEIVTIIGHGAQGPLQEQIWLISYGSIHIRVQNTNFTEQNYVCVALNWYHVLNDEVLRFS